MLKGHPFYQKKIHSSSLTGRYKVLSNIPITHYCSSVIEVYQKVVGILELQIIFVLDLKF